MSKIEQHQASLKLLVIVQVVTMVLIIIAVISFPEPEEITAAMTVMEELDEANWSGFSLFFGLSLFVGYLGLWAWSLWQLYHLNQSGFMKFVGSVGLGLFLNFFIGGSWETANVAFFDEIHMLSAGAIIYIGFFFSDTFDDSMQGLQTHENAAPPVSEESTSDSQ